MSSLDRILPFLAPIAHLLRDEAITEVMVNAGGRRVFVEQEGNLTEIHGCSVPANLLTVAIKNIARSCGEDISEDRPILDARLADGSRIAATFPPCAVDGPVLTIRRFGQRYSLQQLVDGGTLTGTDAAWLVAQLLARKNILISGGTGTGKTTLLNAIAGHIPDGDRLALLEDTSEILIEKPNLIRFEVRRAQGDIPAVTMADLLRATLRHRPDRIILGEVRGPEAFDLLQALNTGHGGSLTTIHANSARSALTRLTHCVLSAGVELPHESVREAIADAVQVVVHIERLDGARIVTDVLQVESEPHTADPGPPSARVFSMRRDACV